MSDEKCRCALKIASRRVGYRIGIRPFEWVTCGQTRAADQIGVADTRDYLTVIVSFLAFFLASRALLTVVEPL
ncbi:hypothetical protein SAMN06309944_1465 [Micrococcales bacterium KH10]|nr:hypothetical protein SAMN06309944_1465 [Micrococcales bacterium KH10]